MTMRVNAAQGVGFDAQINSTSMPEQGINIDFNQFGIDENYQNFQATKKRVKSNLDAYKDKMEIKIPFIGTDYLKFKGDGKMTYGQLREMFGIPPKVLSETNNKKLSDDQIVKDVRINLDDIGWYERIPEDEIEASDTRNMRNYGVHHAGYEKTLTNDDIKKIFGK